MYGSSTMITVSEDGVKRQYHEQNHNPISLDNIIRQYHEIVL